MGEVVRSLFVTLRRGTAGKPWFHRRIVEALGLSRPHDCVEKPNSPTIRGMLVKIPHLLIVETDKMFYYRRMREYYQGLCRPPLAVSHAAPDLPAASAPQLQPTRHTQVLYPPTQHTAALQREHVLAEGMEGFKANWKPKGTIKHVKEFELRERVKALAQGGLYSERVKELNRREVVRKAMDMERKRRKPPPGESEEERG